MKRFLALALAAVVASLSYGLAPGAAPSDKAPAGAVAAAGLTFAVPPGWTRQQPASAMRLAQASVPGPRGPAQLGVFFFGPGSGGSAEDNVSRWIGQFDSPAAAPRRDTFSSHGLRITTVEVAGTMKPSAMGMGPATAQPGWRLLGAVVEGPGGPWFFKLAGPDATVAGARDAFLRMLREARTR
jgi:hypothetical protein